MKLLRFSWSALRWCFSSVAHFLLWTVWLALAALLAVQIIVACSHELRLPRRVVQAFEDRLALSGLKISFDSASFDPTGHVMVDHLRVFTEGVEEPVATCESVFVKIDPWSLAIGNVEVQWIHGHRLTLYVPPMLSPSGRSDPVVEDVEIALTPGLREVQLDQFAGRAGRLALACHGAVRIPRNRLNVARAPELTISAAIGQYFQALRQLALWETRLQNVDDPAVNIFLTPDDVRIARAKVTLTAREITLDQNTTGLAQLSYSAQVSDFRFDTTLPLLFGAQTPFEARIAAGRIALNDGSVAQSIETKITGSIQTTPLRFTAWEAAADLGQIASRGIDVSAASLRVTSSQDKRVSADVSLRLQDVDWQVHADGDVKQGPVRVSAAGAISRSILTLVGERMGRDLTTLLVLDQPAHVSAESELGPNGKLAWARGKLSVDKVVARDVPLDHVEADLLYEGQSVQVSNIVLLQGENLARGSYSMDTATLDYRFLLEGKLRPVGIAGWFHEWWPHFWGNFDFTVAPPQADVDVQGRWRAPHLSTVYVFADCNSPIIRGVPFDRVRTTLFIRPDFYDGIELSVTRGAGKARGRFTRSVDLDKHGFRWMDFEVDSDLELQESARLFGQSGVEIVEPFIFEKPPRLKLKGHLEGEASPAGEHENVDIEVASSGEFHFFDFPLSDLSCHATVQDHNIDVTGLKVRFAGGDAQGSAHVTGRGDSRRLSFDAALQSANIGDAIRILEEYSAKRRGEKPASASKFQQRIASGKLDLRASAQGLYKSAYSFTGSGTAELRGAELASINLFGSLSEAFRDSAVLGFTSWRLDSAKTTFTIEREKLVFPDLRMTGPTARLDAHGAYWLDAKSIAFNAKFYPFDQGKTLLANAIGLVLTPVSAALELKLAGSLDQPKWFFAYGPTNFIRKLTGTSDGPPPEEAEKPAAEHTQSPPTLLRRRD